MSCSPIRSHTGRCSCLTQTWFKQTAQEGSKLLHQGTVAEKVTTPSLCCTVLTLESTVEMMQTYKLMLYYVCRPEWGAVHQDIALTEQKPGGNLRASEANKNTSGGADNPLTMFVKKDSKV